MKGFRGSTEPTFAILSNMPRYYQINLNLSVIIISYKLINCSIKSRKGTQGFIYDVQRLGNI